MVLGFGPAKLEGLNAWTAEQQQAAKDLLVDSADVFSKMIWIWENATS